MVVGKQRTFDAGFNRCHGNQGYDAWVYSSQQWMVLGYEWASGEGKSSNKGDEFISNERTFEKYANENCVEIVSC